MTITEFVNDKDDGARRGEGELDVRFDFFAEHPCDDENQHAEGCATIFDAVDAARRIFHETGRPTQVRISLEVDEEGRYLEQIFPIQESAKYRRGDDEVVQLSLRKE